MECITPFISIYVNLELGKGWISVGPAVNSNHGGFHQPWGFGFTQLWKIMDFASVCFTSFFSSNDVEKTWTQTCPVSMKTAQNSPICHGLQWNWCFSMLVMVIYMDYMVYIYIYSWLVVSPLKNDGVRQLGWFFHWLKPPTRNHCFPNERWPKEIH